MENRVDEIIIGRVGEVDGVFILVCWGRWVSIEEESWVKYIDEGDGGKWGICSISCDCEGFVGYY